jgi:hypothetical protein
MSNPWLAIPLQDYEKHMSSSSVQQLSALSELFGNALRYCDPESVAILGVAGGNGLERINSSRTQRVCGIDINPTYLEMTRQRFAGLPGLELLCMDLIQPAIGFHPVQLVHAALIFEHTGLERCLDNALKMVAPEGSLSVILQLPRTDPEENISSGSCSSIETLREHFQLIDPAHLQTKLAESGLHLAHQFRHPLPSSKAFWMGIFNRGSKIGES